MAYDAEVGLTGRDRLMIVADVIETVDPSKLSLGNWWRDDGCGCILGHAIQQRGRELNMDLSRETRDGEPNEHLRPRIGGRVLNVHDEWGIMAALAIHFDLTTDEAAGTFGCGSRSRYVRVSDDFNYEPWHPRDIAADIRQRFGAVAVAA